MKVKIAQNKNVNKSFLTTNKRKQNQHNNVYTDILGYTP